MATQYRRRSRSHRGPGMTGKKQRLVDVRKAHGDDAAIATTADNDHANCSLAQEMFRNRVFHVVLAVLFRKLGQRLARCKQGFSRKCALPSQRPPEAGYAARVAGEMAATVDILIQRTPSPTGPCLRRRIRPERASCLGRQPHRCSRCNRELHGGPSHL